MLRCEFIMNVLWRTGSSLRKELKWNMEIKTDVDGHVPAPLSSSYKWGNKYSYPEEFKIVKTPAAFQEYESQEKVVPPKPKRRNGINYYEISWKISIYHSSSCAEVTWQHVSLIPSPLCAPYAEGTAAQTPAICIRDHCWKTHNRLESCMNAICFPLWRKKLLWRMGSYYSVLCVAFCLI